MTFILFLYLITPKVKHSRLNYGRDLKVVLLTNIFPHNPPVTVRPLDRQDDFSFSSGHLVGPFQSLFWGFFHRKWSECLQIYQYYAAIRTKLISFYYPDLSAFQKQCMVRYQLFMNNLGHCALNEKYGDIFWKCSLMAAQK